LDDKRCFGLQPAVGHPGYRRNDEYHEAGDGDACVHIGRHEGCGQRFRLSVSERILLVWISTREAQASPHDKRCNYVGRGLDSICNERVSVADDAGHELDDRKHGVDQHADLRRSHSPARGLTH